jgi:hypothetical protein
MAGNSFPAIFRLQRRAPEQLSVFFADAECFGSASKVGEKWDKNLDFISLKYF